MDALWQLTQTPALHARWDLRFTNITYLSRDEPDEPQRFLYETHVAPGIWVRGGGETVGERARPDGSRASALRFWSHERRSLIDEGSGYWRYRPDGERIVFLTRYDYDVRWGRLGRAIDAALFRRLIGWATAWSFDRLRLWLEEGVEPRSPLHALLPGATSPRARRCRRVPAESMPTG